MLFVLCWNTLNKTGVGIRECGRFSIDLQLAYFFGDPGNNVY